MPPRRRAVALATVAAVAAGLTAQGLAVAAGARPSVKPGCARALGAAHARTVAFDRTQARQTARRLLDRAPLPFGATAVASDPSQGRLLRGNAGPAGTRAVEVELHRYFRIPGSWTALARYRQAHAPPDECLAGSGGEGPAAHYPASLFVSFRLRRTPAGLADASIQFSYAAAKGGGAALRIDVWVTWLLPRPSWERIPAGVASVLVADVARPGTPAVASVFAPSTVAALAGYVNGLPRAQPGVYSCPVLLGPVYRLRFRSLAGMPLVTATEQGCGDLSFALGGRHAPPLAEPSLGSLAALLHRLGVV